jgi:hypothetical protein
LFAIASTACRLVKALLVVLGLGAVAVGVATGLEFKKRRDEKQSKPALLK